MPDLSATEIAALKNAVGPLFRTTVDGTECIFRTITRKEAADLGLMDGEVSPEQEDAIVSLALVWPVDGVDLEAQPAGVVSSIAQRVLEASGFVGAKRLNDLLARAKERKTAYHGVAAVVCAAFPALLPGDLDDLPIDKLMELAVLAEDVLLIRRLSLLGEYEPLSFSDGDDEPRELSDEEKDRLLRQQLAAAMHGIPAGDIDRTKVPPGYNPPPEGF